MGRRARVGGWRRGRLARRGLQGERRGLHRRGSRDVVLEHGARGCAGRRHHGEHERDEEKDAGAPPRDLGEQRGRLPAAHELFRAGPAAERRQSPALARLEQHRGGEDDRVGDEDAEQQDAVHAARIIATPRPSAQAGPSLRDRARRRPPARRRARVRPGARPRSRRSRCRRRARAASRRRGAAGADGPYRLVGHDHLRQGAGLEPPQRRGELPGDHGERVPRLAFGERLPDAQHRHEPREERRPDLAARVLVRLAEQLAALGVAYQGRPGAGLERERRRHGPGKGAFGLPVDVLDAHPQVRALPHRLRGGLERDGGGEEPDFPVVVPRIAGPERLEVGPGLVGPEMQLPVGREEEAPHASSSAATPGSGLPSRNSSAAPPPVETCVSRSSRPATAAADSPPPTTVTAPPALASARASATARVPPSKGGVSNTPIGPFQNTVFAATIRARKSRRVAVSMSNTAQSAGMRSTGTSRRSAARARLGATTTPRGSTSFAPACASSACATSTASCSTSDPPTDRPRATRNVVAIAPPTSSSSTRASRARSTPILLETFAPPRTATNGRAGSASKAPRWRSSRSIRNPATAGLSSRAMATVEACARWAEPNASLT